MDRRKFLIGLGSIAVGGAAASGTGAFTAARVGRNASAQVVNDTNAYLGLNAGGARGVGDRIGKDNGDLYIDLGADASGTGLNDEARFQIGAMDDDALGDKVSFTSLYDEDTDPAAAGQGRPLSDGDVDQSAFVLHNQSGQTLDIEISWQLEDNNKGSDGATIYLQGRATKISGVSSPDPSEVDSATATNTSALDLGQGQDTPQEALSFNNDNDPDEAIPAGESVYVSFQVDTRDSDTNGIVDLGGNLVINANETADPGVE